MFDTTVHHLFWNCLFPIVRILGQKQLVAPSGLNKQLPKYDGGILEMCEYAWLIKIISKTYKTKHILENVLTIYE